MKTIFLIIFAITSHNMFSQNSHTPAAPIALSGTTDAGITYSLAKTDTSLAFSCTFDESMYKRVLEMIRNEYPSFNGKLTSDPKLTEVEYKIVLKEKELKIECEASSGKENKDMAKLDNVSSKILKL